MREELKRLKKQVIDVINFAKITEANKDDATTVDFKNLSAIYKVSIECLSRIYEIEDAEPLKELEAKYINEIILLLRDNKYNFELFEAIKKFLVAHGLSESDPALLSKLINLNIKEEKSGKIVSTLKPELEEFLDE